MKKAAICFLILAVVLISCDLDRSDHTPTVLPTYLIDNFCTDTEADGSISFSWSYVSGEFDHMHVDISTPDGSYSDHFVIDDTSQTGFTIPSGGYGRIYSYSIRPYAKDGKMGKTYSGTRYVPSDGFTASLPYIEITTKGHEWPDCDYVTHPEGENGEGITNNDYVMMDMALFTADGGLLYSTSGSEASKIKIRGNSSAYGDKKPYKIKLEKKEDLLSYLTGRKGKQFKDKEWLLLKDGTSLNSLIGFAVNECMGIEYTPAYSYVELFINGDYRGIYILVESVKRGNTDGDKQSRCQVDSDGYVIENDAYWWNEDVYFRTSFFQKNITFKYPDEDDVTQEQIKYIKDYLNEFECALLNLENDSYLQYIDGDSFAAWVMVHEYLGCFDAAGSNQFMMKRDSTQETKIEMTTTWDFDWIMNPKEEGQSANINRHGVFYSNMLLKRKSFMALCRKKYSETRDTVLDAIDARIGQLDAAAVNSARKADSVRWGCSFSTVEEQSASVHSWIDKRLKWMDTVYR